MYTRVGGGHLRYPLSRHKQRSLMQVNQRLTPVKHGRCPGAPEPKPEKAPTPSWPRAPLSREDIDRGRISAGAGIGSAGVLRAERFPLSAACVCTHARSRASIFLPLLEPVGSILCADCAELSLFSTTCPKWEQVLGPACLRWSGSVLSQRWYFYFLILQLALRHL